MGLDKDSFDEGLWETIVQEMGLRPSTIKVVKLWWLQRIWHSKIRTVEEEASHLLEGKQST